MSVTRTSNVRTSTTRRTTATNATNATTSNTAGAATTTAQPGHVPSSAGQVVNAVPVAINGLGGAQQNLSAGVANRFSRDARFDTYSANGDGRVARGFIKCDATPIPGGARLHVETFHAAHNDQMTMYLQAEVLDTKTNQMRGITLAVLSDKANLNGNTYRGNCYFDIKYDDVNKYLQQFNPNLKLNPGTTQLAVAARWGTGHNAGGFGRGGAFRLPASQNVGNAVSVRAASAAGATQDADLPLDMQVNYPANLVQAVPQLKPDGSIQSRLESELKVTSNATDMKSAIHTLYDLVGKAQAGDDKAVEKVLGKDWSIESVSRYWLQDDGSANQPGQAGSGVFKGFRVDDDGLPMQDPMHDVYMDDPNLRMTRHQGAIRLRSNAAATVVNVKPGAGRRDDNTEIVQRVEVGLEMKPGTTTAQAGQALQTLSQQGQWSGTIFNHAQRQVHELDPQLNLQNALQPAFDVTQDRHKFTVVNKKTGVEIELSLDKVNVKSLRPEHNDASGKPRQTEFWILEAELDHLQLASANQSNYSAATASGGFANDQQQTQWLSNLSSDVTMDIEPRLHELNDLNNDSFRRTDDYKAFEGVVDRVLPKLFPAGWDPAVQKAAQAAEAMGLVTFDDQKLLDNAKEVVTSGGFKWTSDVKKAFETALGNPSQRINIENAFVNGQAQNIAQFVQQAGVAPTALEYNLTKLKGRIKGKLESLGLQSTPEINKMLDGANAQKLPPQNLDTFIARMANHQDAQVMTQIAQALGVNPPPQPKVNLQSLFDAGETPALMRTRLASAQVNPKQFDAIEDFFKELGQKGATSFEVRQAMANMHSNPQNRLNQLAQARGLTAPQLQLDLDSQLAAVQTRMRQYHQSPSPEVLQFLQQVCDTRPMADAQQFFSQLTRRQVPETYMAAEAKRMGVPAPKVDYDWGLIDTNLQTRLQGCRVTYTPELKQFVRDIVEGGVPVNTVNNIFAQLANSPDLQAAMRANNVFVIGPTIPDVAYDAALTLQMAQQKVNGYGAAVDAKGLQRTTEALLQQGFNPNQIANYVAHAFSTGPKHANATNQVPGVDASKLPSLAVDTKGLMAHFKTRFGAQLKPEQEQYLQDAVDEALRKDALMLNQVWSQNLPNTLARLQQQSGLARPAGV